MSVSPGLVAYKFSFQLSPIILTGGLAGGIPGGMLPIIAITEALNFTVGLLSSGANIGLDDFFANWQPLPGSTLIDNQIGKYPFANQAVAANALIAQPKNVSMLMMCPARGTLGYGTKLATMLALQAALDQHNKSGGTYIVATPSYFFTNCILLRVVDASVSSTKQVQNAWRFDFERPLLTLEEAQQAQNSLMSKITNGTPIDGQPSTSGLASTVGNPSSAVTPTLIPQTSGAAGAGTVPGPSLQ